MASSLLPPKIARGLAACGAFLLSVRDYAEAGPPLARSLPISLDPEPPIQHPGLLSKVRAGLSVVCILFAFCHMSVLEIYYKTTVK